MIVYYFLENYDLREIEIESEIDVDGRTEITFKPILTDEGGNLMDKYRDVGMSPSDFM